MSGSVGVLGGWGEAGEGSRAGHCPVNRQQEDLLSNIYWRDYGVAGTLPSFRY